MYTRTMNIYVATYDSINFSFLAVGATAPEARATMLAAAEKHSKEYGVDIDGWFSAEDVNVYCLPLGGAVRDHDLIVGGWSHC